MLRIFRHYVPKSLVMLALAELLILFVSIYLAASFDVTSGAVREPGTLPLWARAGVFTASIVLGLMAMGFYHRDQGYQPGMVMLRLALGFVCGFVLMGMVYLVFPDLVVGGGMFATALVCSFVGIASCRLICVANEEAESGHAVLVLGCGERARQIESLEHTSSQIRFDVSQTLPRRQIWPEFRRAGG
ncbi:MAG: hypothetical protein ACU85V_18990, partial [Gammaproteobacteria bacterium]